MRFIRKWSYSCARGLSLQLADSHEKRAVYYYGFQIVIGGIFKFILLFISAAILGILKETAVLLLVFASLRTVAGGYHMDKYGRCMVTSLVIMLAGGLLTKYTHASWSREALAILTLAVFLPGLYTMIKWAPSDTPNKPITKPERRRRLKIISIIHLSLWFVITLALIALELSMVALAGCLGIMLGAFVVAPAGYAFLGFISTAGRKNETNAY